MDQNKSICNQDFKQRFYGSFYGVLKWPDLDQLWSVIKSQIYDDQNNGLNSTSDWYLYLPGQVVPEETAKAEKVLTFIDEINDLLHREHDKDYCGIVYVDNKENPSIVKIFDPNNLGVSCGFSDQPPLPGWVMTKIKPTDLNAIAPTQSRQRWWSKIFS